MDLPVFLAQTLLFTSLLLSLLLNELSYGFCLQLVLTPHYLTSISAASLLCLVIYYSMHTLSDYYL